MAVHSGSLSESKRLINVSRRLDEEVDVTVTLNVAVEEEEDGVEGVAGFEAEVDLEVEGEDGTGRLVEEEREDMEASLGFGGRGSGVASI